VTQRPLFPPHEILDAVVNILTDENRAATGLKVRVGSECFLVTALHAVPESDRASLRIQDMYDPGSTIEELNRHDDGLEGEIAVYRLPKFTGRALDVARLDQTGLYLGQEVLGLGFPGGSRFPVGGGSSFLATPMLKKGIVSVFDGPGQPFLFVDLIANPGFSGGPLIYSPLDGRETMVCGILLQTATSVDKRGERPLDRSELVTAGFSTAAPISDVLKILRSV
jgi:hypothetical protein